MSNRPEPPTANTPSAAPPDVSLLLRAHAEQHWLSREVIPVLRDVETRESLPEDELPAALAYLEVLWCEARSHARETDRAGRLLNDAGARSDGETLSAKARRYHAAVVALREAVARRVTRLIVPRADVSARASVRY
jgi:hypothetical protein